MVRLPTNNFLLTDNNNKCAWNRVAEQIYLSNSIKFYFTCLTGCVTQIISIGLCNLYSCFYQFILFFDLVPLLKNSQQAQSLAN